MPVPFNIYEFFRFIIPGGYFIVLLYVWLALIFKIPISFEILSYQTVAYFFASLIVSIVIDSRDVLQYGRGWLKEADFFQSQFPSRYLLDRCEKCKVKTSCPNPLSESNYITTWFYFFNEHIPNYLRSIILTTGYLCRIAFYTHLFSLFFFYIGLLYPLTSFLKGDFSFGTFTYSGILLIILEAVFLSNSIGKKGEKWYSLFFRALDPTRLRITTGLILGFLNRRSRHAESKESEADIDARGLWPRWQRYNEVQVRWMEINEPLLTEKVCRQAQVKRP